MPSNGLSKRNLLKIDWTLLIPPPSSSRKDNDHFHYQKFDHIPILHSMKYWISQNSKMAVSS